MRLRGKVAIWFWAIYIIGNVVCIYELLFSRDDLVGIVVGLVTMNVIFLPILIRNYVEIKEDTLTLAFGFGKDSMPISDITEVSKSHNPIATSAASLDRIVVKGKRQEIICSVRDQERLLAELKRQNSEIRFRI